LPVEVTLRSAQPIYKLTRRALLVVALLLNLLVAILLAITIATGSGNTVWKAIPVVTGGTFGLIAMLVAWVSSRLKAIARAHADHAEENSV
jgi:high-affinity Fe2+/Pb2+ permease